MRAVDQTVDLGGSYPGWRRWVTRCRCCSTGPGNTRTYTTPSSSMATTSTTVGPILRCRQRRTIRARTQDRLTLAEANARPCVSHAWGTRARRSVSAPPGRPVMTARAPARCFPVAQNCDTSLGTAQLGSAVHAPSAGSVAGPRVLDDLRVTSAFLSPTMSPLVARRSRNPCASGASRRSQLGRPNGVGRVGTELLGWLLGRTEGPLAEPFPGPRSTFDDFDVSET